MSHAYLSSTPMDFCGVFRNDFETMFRYDIDILINRTMVYGSLTIVLALIYAGLIIGLQTLLSSVTGGSNLAIVASTLVIAALFQPLRKRVQDLIDRRFYRRRTKLDFSRSKWYDD